MSFLNNILSHYRLRFRRILGYLAIALAATAIILYGWPTPTIFVVFLEVGLPLGLRLVREGTAAERVGWLALLAILLFAVAGRAGRLAAGTIRSVLRRALCLILVAGVAAGSSWLRNVTRNRFLRLLRPT